MIPLITMTALNHRRHDVMAMAVWTQSVSTNSGGLRPEPQCLHLHGAADRVTNPPAPSRVVDRLATAMLMAMVMADAAWPRGTARCRDMYTCA